MKDEKLNFFANKLFYIILFLSFTLNIGLHLFALRNSNFYFTVDQAKPAISAREIFEHGRLVLKGPETSVVGIYAGPLWNYFISIGYIIFAGHPFGAVFMQIVLQTITLSVLGITIAKKVGKWQSITVILALIFYWRYFETALWDFNPFPLVTLKIISTLLLVKFLEAKKQKYYLLAAIPILLGYNAEVAGAVTSTVFYFLFGLWAIHAKRLTRKNFFFGNITFPIFGGLILLRSLIKAYLISGVFYSEKNFVYSGNAQGLGTFASTNFIQMIKEFAKIISEVPLGGNLILGIIMFLVFVVIFAKKFKNYNKFSRYFIIITLARLCTSFLFYGSNRGWRDWHTIHFYSTLLISYLLILFGLKNKIKYLFVAIAITSHFLYFRQRFVNYPFPKSDSTILSNELKVLDWIYSKTDGDGFNAYTYTATFYDYHYQYLFWWYGKGKYGFVPCEYTIYPKAPKETYVPHYLDYSKPTLGCDRLVFLIIESNSNNQTNKDWISEFKNQTKLLDKTNIGQTTVEKREYLK